MPQIINTNIAALTAQRNLNRTQGETATALQRLSSGLRINSARDDAAGLGIASRMTTQIRGLNQAVRNANDAISLAQTAEGALSTASDLLQRIRELAVQSANATNSATDRNALNSEVNQLVSELDRISQTSEFNGQKLLDGTFGTAVYQIGANEGQTIVATTGNFRTNQYGNYRVTGQATSAAAADYRVTGANNLTVNGALGSATVTVTDNDSAKTIAQNVNAKSGTTGVTATAKTEIDATFSAAGAYTLQVTADNSTAQTVSFTISGTTGADGLSAAITAFNDVSSKTGVTAQLNAAGTGITLSHSTGGNILLQDTTTASAGNVVVGGTATLTGDSTADSAYVSGQVLFNSDKTYSVADASTTVTQAASAGASLTNNHVSDLDVSTVANATAALSIVDSALAKVADQRAKFGALQNRVESTIANLSATSENLQAARSRIQDADFAQETGNLTRSQILQQAGVAILAQANALPQLVLSLLK